MLEVTDALAACLWQLYGTYWSLIGQLEEEKNVSY